MRVWANIPKGEYGFLRRGDGAWVIHTPTAETPALEPAEQFSALGRDEYRLLGLGDGTARVIRFSDLHRHSTSSIQDSIHMVKAGHLIFESHNTQAGQIPQ